MNIGVWTGDMNSVIVESGALPEYAAYFFADDPDKAVVYENGRLAITDTTVPTMPLQAHQTVMNGSYYFAPLNISWLSGYTYEIVERPPNTLGGRAPMVTDDGWFVFGQQVMPVSISREGNYKVEVYDSSGNVVAIYKITVR
jgi:hypothetical protein